jgi:hypothetical protein
MKTPTMKLISRSTAITYRFAADEHGGWACCTVNDATGELSITSDWGNWAYRWNIAHLGGDRDKGEGTLTWFLSDRTSFDYLAGKLTTSEEQRCFDGDATLAVCREMLIEARREWKKGGESDWKWKNRCAIEERRSWDIAVLTVATVLFWSIGIAAGVLWVLWKAPRVLLRGCRDLRARVRRKDPPIPPASVVSSESSVPSPTSDVSK